MSLLVKFLFAITIFIAALTFSAGSASAAITAITAPLNVDENTKLVKLVFNNLVPGYTYKISDAITSDSPFDDFTALNTTYTTDWLCGQWRMGLKTDCKTDTNDPESDYFNNGDYIFKIRGYVDDELVQFQDFKFSVKRVGPTSVGVSPTNPRSGNPIRVTVAGGKYPIAKIERNDYKVRIKDLSESVAIREEIAEVKPDDLVPAVFDPGFGAGDYEIRILDKGNDYVYFTILFTVEDDADGGRVGTPVVGEGDGGEDGGVPARFPDETPEGVLGQYSERTAKIINFLVNFGIGIAGGVAFLLLVYGGFKFIFSVGNPEAVQQGREVITAAIIGLIVVVFSVFLLRLIGISILGLPI